MEYVVKFSDEKYDLYFSRFGAWGLPEWVGKSKIENARKFETKQEARQWIRDMLGRNARYTVAELK